jgi:hypothetical protein
VPIQSRSAGVLTEIGCRPDSQNPPQSVSKCRTTVIAALPVSRTGDAARLRRYHRISREVEMADVLIRDVPEDVIAALDAHAGRLGLSRSEYVRRRLAQDAATPGSPVSVEDLARFADVFGDLADPDVMARAWR